jgi:toxin ParE1/3/4
MGRTPFAYRLTLDAQSDLVDIRRYTLRQWGVVQSQKYIAELKQTIRLLADTPTLGKPRPDVAPEALSFPCVSHVIYYLLHREQIIVFGVLHKRMVPSNHLEHREIL